MNVLLVENIQVDLRQRNTNSFKFQVSQNLWDFRS